MVWEEVAEVKVGTLNWKRGEEQEEQGHSLSVYSLHPSLPGLFVPSNLPSCTCRRDELSADRVPVLDPMNCTSRETARVLGAG